MNALVIYKTNGAPAFEVDLNTYAFHNHTTGKSGVLYSAYEGDAGRATLRNEPSESTWSKFIESLQQNQEEDWDTHQRRFSFLHLGHTVHVCYRKDEERVRSCRFTTVEPILLEDDGATTDEDS